MIWTVCLFSEMCGEDEKITVEKRILLDTIKEYSDHTTIHGINYVFASFFGVCIFCGLTMKPLGTQHTHIFE